MIYKATKLEVFHDLVLVRRIDTTMSPGGLVLIHRKENESNLAKIIEVGPGIEGKPETVPQCKVGEYWLIGRFIGTKIDLDNAEHVMVRWNDCQARVHFDDEALKLLDQAIIAESGKKEAEETTEAS